MYYGGRGPRAEQVFCFLRIGLIEPLSVAVFLLVALYDSKCGCYLRSSVITRRRVLVQVLLPGTPTAGGYSFWATFFPHKMTTATPFYSRNATGLLGHYCFGSWDRRIPYYM